MDIRGARPLHSGCCEAVLECAPHAVDSRIFGSTTLINNNKKTIDNTLKFNFFFADLTEDGGVGAANWLQGT